MEAHETRLLRSLHSKFEAEHGSLLKAGITGGNLF